MMVLVIGFDPGGQRIQSYNPEDGSGWKDNFDVKVLLEPSKCTEEEAVVIVHSHANNVKLRSSQRNSINSSQLYLRLVFIVFKVENDFAVTESLKQEHQEYGDLFLGDMNESYHNLIHKHVLGLQWAAKNCPQRTVIKMDDDIYINFPALFQETVKNTPAQDSWMMGLLHLSLPVLRSGSKWSVEPHDWSGDVWPDFMSGWCYVASSEAVNKMIKILDTMKTVFWIDDVMITGVVADKTGVKKISLNKFFTVYKQEMECCSQDSVICPYLAGPTDHNASLINNLVTKQQYCQNNICDKTFKCNVTNPYFIPNNVVGEVISV